MKQDFPLIPAANGPVYALGLLMAVCLVICLSLLLLFGYCAYSARNTVVTVSESGLQIQGNLYGRHIPFCSIELDQAEVVDLSQTTPYQPRLRTNGIGLPGYQSGWFSLTNRQKALVFLTDRRQILYLPTSEGYVVLLSVERPQALLQTLQQTAVASP